MISLKQLNSNANDANFKKLNILHACEHRRSSSELFGMLSDRRFKNILPQLRQIPIAKVFKCTCTEDELS